jgi:hypothetical protein
LSRHACPRKRCRPVTEKWRIPNHGHPSATARPGPSRKRASPACRGAALALLVTVTPFGLATTFLYESPWALRLVSVTLFGYVLCSLAFTAVPPLNRHRPAAALVWVGWILSATASAVWVASTLLSVQLPLSPSEAWSLENGGIAHITYSRGYRAFAAPKLLRVGFGPGCPFGTGGITLADGVSPGRRWSSRETSWGLWPLALATVVPTWLLRQLRRERVPRGFCKRCGYNLTGNTSGT